MKDKVILITGGSGSLGKHIVKTLGMGPKKIIVFSRDEFKQSEMAKWTQDNVRFFLGDVRDKDRLIQVMQGVDLVIHAAALKQVPATEYNPTEAVKTNVTGSQNVVAACMECGVKKAVLVSTDKAVSPVNLYGATKLVAEKLFIAANSYNKTVFSCVRYGNVMGSRGSVIPLFKKMIADGETVLPVTDVEMTRFWLTLDDAAGLVLRELSDDGYKIRVPIAPSSTIVDLAFACGASEVREVGIRPGEKLHEAMISEDTKHVFWEGGKAGIYTSDGQSLMTVEELKEKLCLTEL